MALAFIEHSGGQYADHVMLDRRVFRLFACCAAPLLVDLTTFVVGYMQGSQIPGIF